MIYFSKIIALVLVLFSIVGYAQDEDNSKKEQPKLKHEIRMISENFFSKKVMEDPYNSSNSNLTDTYKAYTNLFNYGLGYNLNFKNIGFRTRLYYAASSDKSLAPRDVEVDSKHNQYRAALGINYQFQLNKIVLFTGIDFSMFQITDSQKSSSYMQTIYYYKYDNSITYKGYGIEPLVGLKYFITEHFSISSELRFIFDQIKGDVTYNQDSADPSIENYNYKTNFNGFTNRIGPNGSISLNIHF